MDIAKLQSEVGIWARKNFPKAHTDSPFMGMVEELGELAHVRLKMIQNIRTVTFEDEEDAIGDLFIFMCHYCAIRNIDLEDIIKQTWKKVKQRDWIKFPKDGVSC